MECNGDFFYANSKAISIHYASLGNSEQLCPHRLSKLVLSILNTMAESFEDKVENFLIEFTEIQTYK